MNSITTTGTDPDVPDWANIELPDSWADQLQLWRPNHFFQLIRSLLGSKRSPVSVPPQLTDKYQLPKYLLQEFHGLPNGNYSKRITRGYITGFDRSMLGAMAPARKRIADSLKHCVSVLDVGCAGGPTAKAVYQEGVKDVWGLDASPYLLQHAAKDHPMIRFTQGLVEDTGFQDERFEGISACFVLHEIPPRYIRMALDEFKRILKPGGLVAVCEPSPTQRYQGAWQMRKKYGLQALYFCIVARFIHEPFLDSWHKVANNELFNQHGFEVVEDDVGMPMRHLLLRKVAS
ncbi:hypothetical protein NBRC116493_06640 [Aurantivibrio infirmus]